MGRQGIDAIALPLIDIRPAASQQAVCAAQRQLADDAGRIQAVMFVSAAAVSHFLIANNADGICGNLLKNFTNGHCRAWATGQGTVRALLVAGVPALQIDSPGLNGTQWDSESLWAQVSPKLDTVQQVLIVRGADPTGHTQGRSWLATQLEARGIAVQQVAAYERHLPFWTPEQHALAAQTAQGGLWIFSASEAIANLQQLMSGAQWQSANALATHPRIAQTARDAGFGVVCESLPGLAQVIASIKSLR
jgi:uroporphyrinogen-III synthase